MAEAKKTEQKQAPAEAEAPKAGKKTAAPPATAASLRKHADAVAKKLGARITITIMTPTEYHGRILPREEKTIHPEAG